MAIILRANKDSSELGGHIASFQSAATLYDIGFGHFWHAPTDTHGGDLLFIQGHSSPGIYARAFPRRAPDRSAAARTTARRPTARASRRTRTPG
jgi:pyruvate dehydrogenase complex dehydrogenase (E1) component